MGCEVPREPSAILGAPERQSIAARSEILCIFPIMSLYHSILLCANLATCGAGEHKMVRGSVESEHLLGSLR